MRVLFATTHIHFPQGGGGAERNTHDLALAILARQRKLKGPERVEVAVMSALTADGTMLVQANRLRRFLLRHEFPRDMVGGYPTYRGWREDGLLEVLARFKPDVVVVQEIHPQVMVQRLKAAGIPHAVYIHEVEEIDHLRPVGEDGVPFIANSRFTAQRLRERCGIEAHVIRPIIDPAQYVTPTSREHVLFVNTIPRKGVEVALDLARARPDIPFDMVQGWTLKPPQVAALRGRLPANVTLHPATRDMRPRYAQARLLLAPSQWEEAWGRVATEAQVSGIPVLASSRGGLPEAVGDGGLLLPADAPGEEWARALGRLWDDAAAYARYAAAAAEHGRRPEIQPETIVEDLLSLLRGLKGSAR